MSAILILSRFEDYETCELAFVFSIANATAVNLLRDEGAACTPPEAFMLGHFVSPYHPSFSKICDVLNYLFLADINGDTPEDELLDIYFERASEFTPNLIKTEFLNDMFTAFAHCLREYLSNDIPKFSIPENIGKLDFMVPLSYFNQANYTKEDHEKKLEISRQMSAEVYDAVGPDLSSFESGDD